MILSLPLLVPRVLLADDPDHTLAPDYLAMLTDGLYAATHLHGATSGLLNSFSL
jgi:hypothetical protein